MIRFVACLFLATSLSQAQPTFETTLREVQKIQSEPGMKTASVGFCVIPLNAAGPEEARGFQENMGLVPASTMKAITTATAVDLLGPEFRFKTMLQYTGTIDEEGTLNGDVIVKGGGDPTLGSSQIVNTFAKWQAALSQAGIRKIAGRIVGDASIFGTKLLPDSWQWNDMGNYYGAGACGLTFHQNQFFCTFRTGSPGNKAALAGTDPRLPGIEFFNEMRVGSVGSGDNGYIYGVPYGKVFYLRGTVPAGSSSFTIKGSLPDPAFFCARAFTKHLNQRSFEVTGEPTTLRLVEAVGNRLASTRETIMVQQSETLQSIMVLTNHKSVNLRAECIHRMNGVENKGSGSLDEAEKSTQQHWAGKGINMNGFYMADGCGLSRSNTVTAKQMALILYHAAKGENFQPFYNSLPIAGRSGTLRSIGQGSLADGRVRAKSGTLDRIKNYAGYVSAQSGQKYAFALYINNYTCELWEVKSKIVRVWNKMVATSN
ncbi:MAG: D-alanyl-D-alanine carboxypeptidase/D-alanyl-D-alanine-endopeptidase [Verrucomicrobiota bacterium]